ncbi:MAG TPA: oxygenase MpaB family protein [Sporichthyaceae bacterium]|nr:oxygenase MpaB family protein [Sporichthyaceae bacterium]
MSAAPSPRPARARRPAESIAPGSVLWELTGQRLYLGTTGSAFVLQVMHPAIGTVVGQRSSYRSDPWGRAARSFASVQTWVYGGQAAIDEGHRLRAMHKDLSAIDETGRRHHALTAEPWAWVPLTAFHAVSMYSRYFLPRPLTEEQLDEAYTEILQMCRILQVREDLLPPTRTAFWAYYDDMIATTLENHPTAHDVLALAARTPAPLSVPAPLRRLWFPAGMAHGEFNRLVMAGTLPPAARDKLGLTWSRFDEARLRAVGAAAGRANAALPERIKYLPIAFDARRAVRAAERLDRTLATRPV